MELFREAIWFIILFLIIERHFSISTEIQFSKYGKFYSLDNKTKTKSYIKILKNFQQN